MILSVLTPLLINVPPWVELLIRDVVLNCEEDSKAVASDESASPKMAPPNVFPVPKSTAPYFGERNFGR